MNLDKLIKEIKKNNIDVNLFIVLIKLIRK